MARITHGKMFRTRRGKYGCYEYRNGKKVKFVEKKKKSTSRRRSSYTRRY